MQSVLKALSTIVTSHDREPTVAHRLVLVTRLADAIQESGRGRGGEGYGVSSAGGCADGQVGDSVSRYLRLVLTAKYGNAQATQQQTSTLTELSRHHESSILS